MNLHLAEIARNVALGAHAVPLLDQAGWHMTDKLSVPANITILPLPPKCPELNPAENIWAMVEEGVLQKTGLKTIPARNRGEQVRTPGAAHCFAA
jgi:transposase